MAEPLPSAIDRPYDTIRVGDEAEFTRVIGEVEVGLFVKLTGDRSPLHMDRGYAMSTQFEDRIVHGMLVASYFSTLVGMYLPGKRAVYLSQEVQFAKPVRLGERITFHGRVKRKTDTLRMLDIETTARNERGDIVVRGRAQVMTLS